MKTVACTVRGSAGDLVAGDRTGGKTAVATRSDLGGVFKGVDAASTSACATLSEPAALT
jgi:hypothetical protein